jgi:hypothetical protein
MPHMRSGRTILTLVLAFAVAILPAIGGAVSVAEAIEAAIEVSTDTSTSVVSMECCEHHGTPCDSSGGKSPMNDCASFAVCAAKCFSFTGVAVVAADYVPTAAVRLNDPPAAIFISRDEPPPFPPPRI